MMFMCSLLLCCWKRVFAMTSVFSWQNSISLCPASSCNPWQNLPVTPSISWLPAFAFQSLVMKRTSSLGVSFRRSCRSSQNCSTSASSALLVGAWTLVGAQLDYCYIEWFALETNRDHSVILEIASKYYISNSFVNCDGYSFSCKTFLPTVVDIMVIWVKFTHSSPF